MAQSHVAIMEAEDERLDVVRGAGAGRGVTHVADGSVAFEPFDFALIAEHLGEQSESAVAGQMAVIVGDDAGTFLTAMLQRVQAEIGKSGGVGVAPHAEDATFLVNAFEFSRQAKAPFSNRGLTICQPYQSAATSRVVSQRIILNKKSVRVKGGKMNIGHREALIFRQLWKCSIVPKCLDCSHFSY